MNVTKQIQQLKASLEFFSGLSHQELADATGCEKKKGDEGRAAVIQKEVCYHIGAAITSLESHQ